MNLWWLSTEIAVSPFDKDCKMLTKTDELFITTVGYNDLGYQELPSGHVKALSREELIGFISQNDSVRFFFAWLTVCDDLQKVSKRVAVKRRRRLGVGGVNIAVNGRVGRRLVCITDKRGTFMEMLDFE